LSWEIREKGGSCCGKEESEKGVAPCGKRESEARVSGGKGTVLLCEDEDNIADLVRIYLEEESYRVIRAKTGGEALDQAARQAPCLLLLDVGLPDMNGFDVCRVLRERGNPVPVLFLTARDSEIDKVLGLELGADDYVTKPFSPRELTARVKAVLRRSAPEVAVAAVAVGDAVIDAARREIRLAGQNDPVFLTAKEFDLLWFLAENKGLVMSREQILRNVWGYEWAGETRTVDAHIRQLRKKLGDALPIKTVWRVGYQIAEH